jgi:hypothetical protein
MLSHARAKFDQHLLSSSASLKQPDGLKKLYAVLQRHLDGKIIEQKPKRTFPRMPNPFINLAPPPATEDESDDDEEEKISAVATYFDPVNMKCKRIMSNGPPVEVCDATHPLPEMLHVRRSLCAVHASL